MKTPVFGEGEVTEDHTTPVQFFKAWNKILELFDLHRLNRTPSIATETRMFLGLQNAVAAAAGGDQCGAGGAGRGEGTSDFLQIYRVTLIGKTVHDVETVVSSAPEHCGDSAVSIQMCEVGPAAFSCGLHFDTRERARAALLSFQRSPLVSNMCPRVKVSLTVKSDTGGLVIRPISALEALATACKTEIQSDSYSSDFSKRLQPVVEGPIDTLLLLAEHWREFLSDERNGFSTAIFHVRSVVQAGECAADRSCEVMKLKLAFDNLTKLNNNLEHLHTWIFPNVLQPLREGVDGLSDSLTNSILHHPASLPAVCKVLLDFYISPTVKVLSDTPAALFQDVSKTFQHIASLKSMSPKLKELKDIFYERNGQKQQQQQQHQGAAAAAGRSSREQQQQ